MSLRSPTEFKVQGREGTHVSGLPGWVRRLSSLLALWPLHLQTHTGCSSEHPAPRRGTAALRVTQSREELGSAETWAGLPQDKEPRTLVAPPGYVPPFPSIPLCFNAVPDLLKE